MSVGAIGYNGVSACGALWDALLISAYLVGEVSTGILIPNFVSSVVEVHLGGGEMGHHIVVVGHSLIGRGAEKGENVIGEGLVSCARGTVSVHRHGVCEGDLFFNINACKGS